MLNCKSIYVSIRGKSWPGLLYNTLRWSSGIPLTTRKNGRLALFFGIIWRIVPPMVVGGPVLKEVYFGGPILKEVVKSKTETFDLYQSHLAT